MRDSRESEAMVATSESDAARISGFSRSQLRYWDKVGLLHPSTVRTLSPHNVVRLYDFRDLLALLVIKELKSVPFSTYRIRKVVEFITARYDYEVPLTELRFAVGPGDEIFFQHPDGGWEGHRMQSQVVLEQTLHLEPLRARLHESLGRGAEQEGKIEKRRGVLGSKPVIAGTRVPVEVVTSWLAAGHSTERILAAYPQLTTADVDAVRRQRSSVA